MSLWQRIYKLQEFLVLVIIYYFFLLKFWLPFSFLWSPASDKNHKTAVWEQSQRAVCVCVSVGRCCHASHDSLDISHDTCGAWQKVDSKVLQLILVQSDPVLPIVNTFYYSWFCCSLFLIKYKRSRSRYLVVWLLTRHFYNHVLKSRVVMTGSIC